MRRFLIPLFAATALVLSACAGGSATENATTPAAAEATPSQARADESATADVTEAMTDASTVEAMTEAMTDEASTQATTGEAVTAGTVITTGSSEFGEILFDGNQQAIYLFDKETSPTPDCYDDCAVAWPPVLTTGEPAAAGGIDVALLGTTARTDGTTQVTYGGHPLYYYVDEDNGEVKCHNVEEFGGLWLVVTPSGVAAPV